MNEFRGPVMLIQRFGSSATNLSIHLRCRVADRFAYLEWPPILNRYARQVVRQLDDVLQGRVAY